MHPPKISHFDSMLKYGLYPLLLGITLIYLRFEFSQPQDAMGKHYGLFVITMAITLMLLEAWRPMRLEWRMTCNSFLKRDLPYLLLGATTIAMANFAGGWIVLHMPLPRGTAHSLPPLIPSVILALIIPEFFWYWIHRWSHEAKGTIGHWLWRMHLAHHLPQQLYIAMHAVAHPLNTLVVRLILTLPLYLLGFSTPALFVASTIVSLQGFVSHFNVAIRTGWLNYVLVGNELHRYHHSAAIDEAKNFGNTVPLWDLLFGTFVYHPNASPQALGLSDPDSYPTDTDIVKTLKLPFSA